MLSESNAIIEGMSKAYKYSPEEKKEKIEKYRSKRNLRNFNKRIKVNFYICLYVCSIYLVYMSGFIFQFVLFFNT